MFSGAPIVVLSRFYPAPSRRAELMTLLEGLATQAVSTEACFQAQVFHSDQDEESIVLIARWTDEASLQAFLSSIITGEEREIVELLTRPVMRERFHAMEAPTG
jgi:quinol monooxygenase YgiN